jgi:hypothetical protein
MFEKDLANMRMLPPRISDSLFQVEKKKAGIVSLSDNSNTVSGTRVINKYEPEAQEMLSAGPVLQPDEIFGKEAATSLKGFLILALGGLLIGFGSRYAGGCIWRHTISGLSNLHTPSLLAVIGFFIGGLIMVHLIIPFIF